MAVVKVSDMKELLKNKTTTPVAASTPVATSKITPGTAESHQAWINNSASGQGGLDAYTTRQNQRYSEAIKNNDTDLIDRLKADAQRVGYTLKAPATVATITSDNSSLSYIDSLSEARKKQALADLEKSRDAALSNLSSEKSAIQPKYYDAKNQTAASSQQQARNFAEFMAARGGTNSGTNAQAELTRGMTLQGNLGSLGRQEAQAYTDIERRTSDLQNAYQSDIASANAGIEADRMQAMLNDYYQQQQLALQIAQLTGNYNGQQTLAGQAQNWGQQMDLANLTGLLNGQKTLQAQQIDRANYESDRDYNYAVGQQQWQNNFQQSQFDWQKAQQAWENTFQEKNFEQSMKEAAASKGLQWASLSQRDKEFVAEQAFKEKQFNYTKEQDALANTIAQQKSASNPSKNEIEAEYYTNLDRMSDAQRRQFFKNEAANIRSDLGQSGYTAMKEYYEIYD